LFPFGWLLNRTEKQIGETRLSRGSPTCKKPNLMRGKLFCHLKRPVVVAVSVMRMMQSAINQIIHVVAVRNGGVAAVGIVDVLPVMAFCAQRAFVRVGVADGNGVFIHVVAVRMVQMAVVEIIHVPAMHDGDVSTAGTVDVGMIGVSCARM